jgi:hypothetical protein
MKLAPLFLCLVSTYASAVKPPAEVLSQMETMATVQAAIEICLNSTEYKNLSATEALKFHDVSLTASNIIESIEKRYDDQYAYMAFITASIKISESLEFKRDFAKTYSRKCAQQLLTDSNQTLNSVRTRINSLIKKK